MSDLSYQILTTCLDYNSETGVFIWKKRFNSLSRAKIGSIAGGVQPDGYIKIGLNGAVYAAHRLAWYYVYGNWPRQHIDHINHNRTDNRIKNLREVNISENGRNRKLDKRNKSGVTGVYWAKYANKYEVRICSNSKKYFGGMFYDIEQAIICRKRLEADLGFHNNHGQEL